MERDIVLEAWSMPRSGHWGEMHVVELSAAGGRGERRERRTNLPPEIALPRQHFDFSTSTSASTRNLHRQTRNWFEYCRSPFIHTEDAIVSTEEVDFKTKGGRQDFCALHAAVDLTGQRVLRPYSRG